MDYERGGLNVLITREHVNIIINYKKVRKSKNWDRFYAFLNSYSV